MFFAKDSNGNTMYADEAVAGNYWCIECKKKSHWRHPTDKVAHFFHFEANPDCSLSKADTQGWKLDEYMHNLRNENYRERWMESIDCLLGSGYIYLLEGEWWSVNPIVFYLKNTNHFISDDTLVVLIGILESIKNDKSVTALYTFAQEITADKIKLESILKNNCKILKYIPYDILTHEICLFAVQKNDNAYKFVPENYFKDKEFCKVLVGISGFDLSKVPREMRTLDICLAAVQQDWRAFNDVPKEMKTHDICLAAVQQDLKALHHIPKDIRNTKETFDAFEKTKLLDIKTPLQSRTKKTYEKTINEYTEIISLSPDYPILFNNRGAAYVGTGKYDKAIEDYSEAIMLKPDYTIALKNRGYAYYNLNQHEKALEDFEMALQIDPDLEEAKTKRAEILKVLGRG